MLLNKIYISITLILSVNSVFSSLSISKLTDNHIKLMKEYKVITNKLPVNINNLRLLTVKHYDFNGEIKHGKLIVHASIARAMRNIFKDLLIVKFPINKILLIEEIFIQNQANVANNISSSFYDRDIKHIGIYHRYNEIYAPKESPKNLLKEIVSLFKSDIYKEDVEIETLYSEIASQSKSLHAYGFAIDINPVQNPMIYFMAADQIQPKQIASNYPQNLNLEFNKGLVRYFPYQGIRYANRKQDRNGIKQRQGMVENIVEIFSKHGINDWGGDWDMPIDLMHFQIPQERAYILEEMTNQESLSKAINYFTIAKNYYNENKHQIETKIIIPKEYNGSLLDYYKNQPNQFYNQVVDLNQT